MQCSSLFELMTVRDPSDSVCHFASCSVPDLRPWPRLTAFKSLAILTSWEHLRRALACNHRLATIFGVPYDNLLANFAACEVSARYSLKCFIPFLDTQ